MISDFIVIEKVFNFLNVFLISVGGLITWLYMVKYEKKKNISSAIKETKINNVDGDRALIEQLDMLLSKVAQMSDSMSKVQNEVSELRNLQYSYKSALRRIKSDCNEFCKDAEYCKECIDKILKELNISEKNV